MKTIDERFWTKVSVRDQNICWLWMAAKFNGGYGAIGVNGKTKLAHRISYELHNGQIPDGLHVLHSCDNPGCVNPAHLHLGTQLDNMREKADRRRSASGETNGNAKLTEQKVVEIRYLYSSGSLSQQQLADEFGVSKSTVFNIVNRKKWRHI